MSWARLQDFWSESWLADENYKIFEVPVSVFSRAYGHAVAKKPWVRGWKDPGRSWSRESPDFGDKL